MERQAYASVRKVSEKENSSNIFHILSWLCVLSQSDASVGGCSFGTHTYSKCHFMCPSSGLIGRRRPYSCCMPQMR